MYPWEILDRLARWRRTPEIIGAKDCPIILRWTIVDAKPPTVSPSSNPEGLSQGKPESLILLPKWLTRDRKLMLHRFLPNVEDRDPHDHPRGFWTFVLRGEYLDLVPCACEGKGWTPQPYRRSDGTMGSVATDCDHDADEVDPLVVGDRMKAGSLRYRPAEHRHITQSSARGAWTLVVMGPLERPWGFWRDAKWWPWKDYEAEFGFAMRCPSEEEREGRMLKYAADGEVIYKAAPVGMDWHPRVREPQFPPPEEWGTRGGREPLPNSAPRSRASGRTSLTIQEAREQDRQRETERKDGPWA